MFRVCSAKMNNVSVISMCFNDFTLAQMGVFSYALRTICCSLIYMVCFTSIFPENILFLLLAYIKNASCILSCMWHACMYSDGVVDVVQNTIRMMRFYQNIAMEKRIPYSRIF